MDLLSDLLSRINNALKRNQEMFEMPASKIVTEVARKLMEEGYITRYEVVTRGKKRYLKVTLKYGPDKYGKPRVSVIAGLKRVSRPGRRIFKPVDKIPRIHSGFGTAIISTSSGIMTDSEAREKHVSGEILAYVW